MNRKCSVVLSGVLLCLGTAAIAADASPPAAAPLARIAAQPLEKALTQFSRQSGLQLIYASDLVIGRDSGGSPTGVSPADALKHILSGTGLTFSWVNDRTVSIWEEGAKRSPGAASGASSASPDAGPLRLAQAQSAAGQSADQKSRHDETQAAEADAAKGTPEILVQGSRILNMDIRRSRDDAQPYVIFDRTTIEQSGATNLEDFFKKKLTMSTSSSMLSQTSDPKGNVSDINLRGLGSDETLILVDGRRIASFGSSGVPQQPDINGIPLSAIERIEILPTTASGIYGGGATGGAINIIMRRDYAGLDVNLNYANTFDSDAGSRNVELSGGFPLESGRTRILMTASWRDANTLLVGDRDFEAQRRAHIMANAPATILNAVTPIVGSTANIRSSTGAPLTLKGSNRPLNSAVTSVPIGYAGPASDSGQGFIDSAGRYNLELPDTAQGGASGNGARQALLNSPEVKSFMASVRREFTPRISAFMELSTSRNAGSFVRSPLMNVLIIPGTAPGNPFNQGINVTIPSLGEDRITESTLDMDRLAGGLVIGLPGGWSVGLDYTWNRSEFGSSSLSGVDGQLVTPAVNSGQLNIFRDTSLYPINLSQYFQPQILLTPAKNTLRNASARVSGALPWRMPGGTPRLSGLIEHREDNYGGQRFINEGIAFRSLYPSQTQSVASAYVEINLPLLAPRGHSDPLLELQLAARHDRYRTVGSRAVQLDVNLQPLQPIVRSTNRFESTSPTVALRIQPLQDLALRASYGTGFLPPSVNQLVSNDPSDGSLAFLRDPQRGFEPLGIVRTIGGGNPDLRPEESVSRAAGIILTPRSIPGFRFSADWNRIEKTDNIANLSATFATQQGMEDLLRFLPERFVRAAPSDGYPVGRIIERDTSLANIARLNVEAVDFAADYSLESAAGGFQFGVNATRMISIQTQLIGTAPVVEGTGVGVLPLTLFSTAGLKWRINSAVTWIHEGWALGWNMRYYDSYFLNSTRAIVAAQGAASVPSQHYHDVFARYRFPEQGGMEMLSGMELQLGVNNVLNTSPPIDVVGNGFNSQGYSYFGDPRLANYYLTMRKSFGSVGR